MATAALACMPGQARAGSASGADFLLLEPSAKAVAQGGALAATGGELASLRYNPAGLVGLKGLNLAASHLASGEDWSHDWLALGLGTGPLRWGAEVLFSQIKSFDLYDENGRVFDSASAGSQTFLLDLALPASRWLSLGAGARYFRSQLYTFSSQGAAVDLGLQAGIPSWPLRVGLALQNLGSQSAYFEVADPLPLCLRTGAEGGFNLFEDLRLRAKFGTVSYQDPARPLELRLGAELEILKRGWLRAGLVSAGELRQWSLGAGVQWNYLEVNYAFQPSEDLGNSHMIELRLRSQ